jgi:mono/diheme cytochrome c family protein
MTEGFASLAGAFTLAAALWLQGCATATEVVAGDAAEGQRVAQRVGCSDCHGRDGGGAELWGEDGRYTVRSPNLTERRAFYSDEALRDLLREGRAADGRRLFGMPFVMLQALSDREIRDIAAWLRALPAVSRASASTWMSNDVRREFDAGTLREEVEWRARRGLAVLSEPPREMLALGQHLAMTSCSECHAPSLDGWGPHDDAPSLVVAKAYSLPHFTRLMRTGLTLTGLQSKTGLMTMMGRQRFPALNDAEILALKTYLDSRP